MYGCRPPSTPISNKNIIPVHLVIVSIKIIANDGMYVSRFKNENRRGCVLKIFRWIEWIVVGFHSCKTHSGHIVCFLPFPTTFWLQGTQNYKAKRTLLFVFVAVQLWHGMIVLCAFALCPEQSFSSMHNMKIFQRKYELYHSI